MRRRVGVGLLGLVLLCLAVGCGNPESWHDRFPEKDAIPGWVSAGEVQEFDHTNLYDLVNGQADSFFVYGFEKVYVRTYENERGEQLRIELWQLDSSRNAYGLYTTLRGGEPIAVGNGGDTDPGRRVDFWQDRALVRIFTPVAQDPSTLETFANAISKGLPAGGRMPALIERLPHEGLAVGSEVFFHEEVSIQDNLWLGGENVLSLGPETDAVLARYEAEDGGAWLLLVEYAEAGDASAALDALLEAGLENVCAAAARERLLGAVFGKVPRAEAEQLLASALEEGG